MAQVDIAGLLTGIPSLQDPMTQGRINAANLPANASVIERELARQRPSNEANMRRAVSGLLSSVTGSPIDLRTQGAKAREAIGQLDANSPEYQAQLLTQLAKVDPMRAAGVRQQLNAQKAKQDKETQQKTALKGFANAQGQPDLAPLIDSGVITPANIKDYLQGTGNIKDNFMVVDSQLIDLRTKQVVVNKKTENELEYKALVAANDSIGKPTMPYGDFISQDKLSPQRRLFNELNAENPLDYPSFSQYMKDENRELITVTNMTPEGAETTSIIDANTGETVRDLGITKLPTLEIQSMSDGRFQLFNPIAGILGEPVDTLESAQKLLAKQQATNASLIQLETNMGLVGLARKLGLEGSGRTLGKGAASVLGLYTIISNLPFGTDSAELANVLTTLKSELTFGKLQEMRRNSANGSSGLGQVTNVEIGLLSAAVVALDPSLGEERFNEQLKRVERHYKNFRSSLLGVPVSPNYNDSSYDSVKLLTEEEMQNTGETNSGRFLAKMNGKWYIRNNQTNGFVLAPE
tara:strand:- start:1723 stop:3288 length:1566 start_codon:yes stop_codon:yes gene_type:complete